MEKKETQFFQNKQQLLLKELNRYKEKTGVFTPYMGITKIVVSQLFEQQLKTIIEEYTKHDEKGAKNFALYLQTIIVNMETKVTKYKKSIYFDDENIKDIENQGYVIPFYVDDLANTYVILGII